MMDEVEEQEMIEERRSRRKAARRLMGAKQHIREEIAFNQFQEEGDPLPPKGAPIAVLLRRRSGQGWVA
jgi:hypothetical protein